MCESSSDREWRAFGASSWSKQIYVFEQCTECGTYRARTLDPYDIPIVDGMPSEGPASSERDSSSGLSNESPREEDADTGGLGDSRVGPNSHPVPPDHRVGNMGPSPPDKAPDPDHGPMDEDPGADVDVDVDDSDDDDENDGGGWLVN